MTTAATSVDQAAAEARRLGVVDGISMGFIHYAAMAAQRAQDAAVMCRILGCHELLREYHASVFDHTAAHFDAQVYAALRGDRVPGKDRR